VTGKRVTRRRGSYLQLWEFERLEEWCRLVSVLFDGEVPYLVGSANTRPDYRDVDLRVILEDEVFDTRWRDPVKLRYMNRAVSAWGQRDTGLPIDFQIQRMTEANEQFPTGPGQTRNAMGLRDWSLQRPAGVPVGAF